MQLIAGGRFDSLHDHNYSAYASCSDFSVPGNCDPQLTTKHVWLPQYAVTFNPVDKLTLYGNYGVLLSLGPQAPFWTDNGSQFLAPFFTRQAEVGAKYRAQPAHSPDDRALPHALAVLLSKDHCRSRQFLPQSALPGDQCFESEGRETHDGVELNAEGKAANWLRLTASVAAISAHLNQHGHACLR